MTPAQAVSRLQAIRPESGYGFTVFPCTTPSTLSRAIVVEETDESNRLRITINAETRALSMIKRYVSELLCDEQHTIQADGERSLILICNSKQEAENDAID